MMGMNWVAFSLSLGSVLLVLTSLSRTTFAATIIVGGSEQWHFGFNYTDWALKTSPFYQNDTLVFKYDPPNSTTYPHSVYLLKNLKSFQACSLKKATLVGNEMQGGGKGLEFVLKKRKTYYFACGVHGGFHCRFGFMRFIVHPLKRYYG